MKWFKHDSDAYRDAKLTKVRIKYGLAGYGLYWYCLELIAQDVDQSKITFELEHDSEIISHDTGINVELIQEMITFMVKLNLFENNSGIISCLKMAKRLDSSMTSNPQMRKIIQKLNGKSHDPVMIESCKIRLDKIRNKDLSKSDDLDEFDKFWKSYPRKDAKKKTRQIWKKIPKSKKCKIFEDLKTRYKNTKKEFIPLPTSYLNGERWEDEITNGLSNVNEFYTSGII